MPFWLEDLWVFIPPEPEANFLSQPAHPVTYVAGWVGRAQPTFVSGVAQLSQLILLFFSMFDTCRSCAEALMCSACSGQLSSHIKYNFPLAVIDQGTAQTIPARPHALSR